MRRAAAVLGAVAFAVGFGLGMGADDERESEPRVTYYWPCKGQATDPPLVIHGCDRGSALRCSVEFVTGEHYDTMRLLRRAWRRCNQRGELGECARPPGEPQPRAVRCEVRP